MRDAITARNRDISGGEIETGKRRYLLRTIGRFEDLEDLSELILARRGDSLIRLGDVAEVQLGPLRAEPPVLHRRRAGHRPVGAARGRLQRHRHQATRCSRRWKHINRDVLKPAGMVMRLIADDVGYVEASLGNVWTNLAIGAVLASLVMFLFLRSGCAPRWSA